MNGQRRDSAVSQPSEAGGGGAVVLGNRLEAPAGGRTSFPLVAPQQLVKRVMAGDLRPQERSDEPASRVQRLPASLNPKRPKREADTSSARAWF